MRRLTGTVGGVEYEVLEDEDGQVDCPEPLRDQLALADGSLPTGVELEQACRLLFGATFDVQEY